MSYVHLIKHSESLEQLAVCKGVKSIHCLITISYGYSQTNPSCSLQFIGRHVPAILKIATHCPSAGAGAFEMYQLT